MLQIATVRHDLYFQFNINGEDFAFLDRAIVSTEGSNTLNFEGRNVVLLKPLTAFESNTIRCAHFVALDRIVAENGENDILASKKLIMIGCEARAKRCNRIVADLDIHVSPAFQERVDVIRDVILKGIADIDPGPIIYGLTEIADIALDPLCDTKEFVSRQEMQDFFGIPESFL